MKKFASNLKTKAAALWNDESAQGATEYIVLLAVVVIVVAIFKDKIKSLVSSRMDEVTSATADIGKP